MPVWWKNFGLIREPKLDVHPLTINENRLFVETDNQELRVKIYDHFDDPTSFFHKTFAILGEFGSGKTTLVNYIRYYFRLKGVNTFNINLNWTLPSIEKAEDVSKWFFEELQAILLRACEAAHVSSSDEKLSEAMELLRSKKIDENSATIVFQTLTKHYSGFTLFLDELHKPPQYQHVLSFLKGQQTFFHALCEMPIVIFVSCLDDWDKNFALDSYSGIFDELVKLPTWSPRSAYTLIDRRLKDASSEPAKFKNPFSHEAITKISLLPNVTTPRKWIIQMKRVLESTPFGIRHISASMVSQFAFIVDDAKIEKIKNILHEKFPQAFSLIFEVLKQPSSERHELLLIVARIYRSPLPRPLAEEDRKRIGIDGLPLLVETLKQLKIVKETTQSSPPIRVGKRVVEIQYKEIYRLNQHLMDFFDKVEQDFGLNPEDYILRFAGEIRNTTQATSEKENNVVSKIRMIKEKLEVKAAKDHIQRSLNDYEIFIGTIFTESPSIDLPGIRAGIMSMYHILASFVVERTLEEKHKLDFYKDLALVDSVLNPGENVVNTIKNLYEEFQNVELLGSELAPEFSYIIRMQIPEIMSRISTQFLNWLSISPTTRQTAKIMSALDKLSNTISKPDDLLRSNAVYYVQTLMVQRGVTSVSMKWVESFFDLLAEKQADKLLAELIDIRCNPQSYGTNRFQVYKTALLKIGPVFEETAMIIGRRHMDPSVQKTFQAKKLTLKYMLQRLYPNYVDLKNALEYYGDFDRSQNEKDFEQKLNDLMGSMAESLPLHIRAYAMTALVRNYYSHEACPDTEANKTDVTFFEVINMGTLAAVLLVKDHIDRGAIPGFKSKSP